MSILPIVLLWTLFKGFSGHSIPACQKLKFDQHKSSVNGATYLSSSFLKNGTLEIPIKTQTRAVVMFYSIQY